MGASLSGVLKAPSHVLDAVGTVVRLALSAVWLVSGSIKLADPGQTFLAVQAYDVLPADLVGWVATALPLLELVLGLTLLAGLRVRLVAVCSTVILIAFIAGLTQAWARGLTIDCGCFGGGGQVAADRTEYPREIAVDLGFLLLACWLMIRPQSQWSLDGWLAGTRREPAEHDDLVQN